MVVACLLHDVGYALDFKGHDDHKNHGRYGAQIARSFLLGLGYIKEDAEEMCCGIAIHVDDQADFEFERTPLALSVSDADNIDRFDAYRLYESLHLADYMNLPLRKQESYILKKIAGLERLKQVEFVTKTSEKFWQEKIDFQLKFMRRLKKENAK